LKEEARKRTNGATVKDYAMGIGLCAVVLSDGRSGVAYTAREAIPWGCSLYDELPKVGAPAEEFIDMLDSKDVLLCALGMATINACINQGNFENADITKEINITKSDVVGMIGDFTPMVDAIKASAKELYIFEKEKIPGTIPTEKIPEFLPKCDILMISATTLLNRTFDSIIQHAKTDRIYMLGPSTPICPKALPEVKVFGATLVNENALKTVYHGGGTRNLYKEKTGKKVNFVSEN
jgi:uncharacterized protein (DUF4213/DUF364 family)